MQTVCNHCYNSRKNNIDCDSLKIILKLKINMFHPISLTPKSMLKKKEILAKCSHSRYRTIVAMTQQPFTTICQLSKRPENKNKMKNKNKLIRAYERQPSALFIYSNSFQLPKVFEDMRTISIFCSQNFRLQAISFLSYCSNITSFRCKFNGKLRKKLKKKKKKCFANEKNIFYKKVKCRN